MIKKVILATFPKHTRRGKVVKKTAVRLGLAKPFVYDQLYQLWLDNAEEALFLHPIDSPKTENPLFSIVVPIFNTPDKYLQPLIYSITNQSFQNWELVLADGSTSSERREAIKQATATDKRIKYFHLKKNEGISENTNAGVKQAKGEFIVFCDHDDTLSPHALNELAAVLEDHPQTEIIYSDEDKITDDGVWRHWPHFKPDWSPHQFLSCNYTSHISAVKKELVDKVGGLRTECNGAQDYDLLLQIHALPGKRNVRHIPKILYHWRTAEGSTAGEFSVKDYALRAGETALTQYLTSQGVKAEVKCLKGRPGFYDPIIQPKNGRKVVVIIGDKDSGRMGDTLKTKYSSLTQIDKFGNAEFITWQTYEKNKEKYDTGLRDDDVIVSIKDNVVPKNSDWLERLVGALELEDIHAVAPRIVAYDGRIWDMGIVEDAYGEPLPLFRGLLVHDDTMYGHTEWIRDVDQLSGQFFAVRKKDWGQTHTATIVAPEEKYCTVWSVVEAVYFGPLSGKTKQYNQNIEVGDGHPTVLWQKK